MSELVSAWTDAYTAVLQAQAAYQAEIFAHHLPVLLAHTQTSSPYTSQVSRHSTPFCSLLYVVCFYTPLALHLGFFLASLRQGVVAILPTPLASFSSPPCCDCAASKQPTCRCCIHSIYSVQGCVQFWNHLKSLRHTMMTISAARDELHDRKLQHAELIASYHQQVIVTHL